MLACTAAAAQNYGVINYSASYLRAAADYESALETQELMGVIVEIQEQNGYWLKVKSPQPYTAWCTELGVVNMNPDELEKYEAAPKYIVTAFSSRVLDKPGRNGGMVCDLVQGDILRYDDADGKKPKQGFVPVILPDGREGYVDAADVCDLEKWAGSRKLSTAGIVASAREYLGIPYLWGGMTTKGFDCSGFVRHVYLMNGAVLPRNASQMVSHGVEVSDFSRLKAGDLLFFGQKGNLLKKEKITHVGIYIGGGRFIHSSHCVRINSLREGEPDYYPNANRLIRAKRLVGTEEARSMNVLSSGYFPM